MATSQTSSLLNKIISGKKIPEGKLAYLRERQRNRLYDIIVSRFLEKEKAGLLTKADIARRINKNPAQITRWLSTPSNWTLDTISDLMAVICEGELSFGVSKFSNIKTKNYTQLDRLG